MSFDQEGFDACRAIAEAGSARGKGAFFGPAIRFLFRGMQEQRKAIAALQKRVQQLETQTGAQTKHDEMASQDPDSPIGLEAW